MAAPTGTGSRVAIADNFRQSSPPDPCPSVPSLFAEMVEKASSIYSDCQPDRADVKWRMVSNEQNSKRPDLFTQITVEIRLIESPILKVGAGDRIRTGDVQLGKTDLV